MTEYQGRASIPPVSDEELSAFADGRLSGRRAAWVARHLRVCPEDADRLHAYWRQESLLYRVWVSGAGEPSDRERRQTTVRGPALAAVMLSLAALLTIGLGGPWFDRAPRGFVDVAFEAYRRGGEPPSEVAERLASMELQTVARRHWRSASGREMTEYRLLGPDNRSMALYISPASKEGDSRLRVFERERTRLVEWIADGHRYALVGDGALAPMARLVAGLRGESVSPAVVPTSTGMAVAPAPEPAPTRDPEPRHAADATVTSLPVVQAGDSR